MCYGGQIVNTLAHTDLHGAAPRGSRPGVKVGKPCQYQTIASLGHAQGIGLADDSLAVQRETAVHFYGTHGHNDDVIALQIFLNLAVEHFG